MSSQFTKKRIIKTSVDVILSKGYDAARTKEIAEKSGVSEATLFKYFKSKEDLLKIIIVHMIEDFTKESKEIISRCIKDFNNGSYKKLLQEIIVERLNFFTKNNKLIKIIVREMLINPVLKKLFVQTIYNNLTSILEVVIAKGIKAGEFSKGTALSTIKDNIFGIIIYNTVIYSAIFDNKKDAIETTDAILNGIIA